MPVNSSAQSFLKTCREHPAEVDESRLQRLRFAARLMRYCYRSVVSLLEIFPDIITSCDSALSSVFMRSASKSVLTFVGLWFLTQQSVVLKIEYKRIPVMTAKGVET